MLPSTIIGTVATTTARLRFADRWDHVLARVGWNRAGHRVAPGLYALGAPGRTSRVFATASYTLSFDALRSSLIGHDAYILVLDTRGVNVWCAAAKGTFGTDELVRRIEASGLTALVGHRRIIVPQLGAAGIAAHEVQRRTGFVVAYGPVRAEDLPEYLRLGEATAEMRRVRFDLADRLVLIPVEVVPVLLPALLAAAVLWFVAGPLGSGSLVAAVVAGTIFFPALLPWLPTRECTTKGAILGAVVALPFALAALAGLGDRSLVAVAAALAILALMIPVTAYLALNFTGSTTFTSRTGVRCEIDRYIRPMAASLVAGLVLLALVGIVAGVGPAV